MESIHSPKLVVPGWFSLAYQSVARGVVDEYPQMDIFYRGDDRKILALVDSPCEAVQLIKNTAHAMMHDADRLGCALGITGDFFCDHQNNGIAFLRSLEQAYSDYQTDRCDLAWDPNFNKRESIVHKVAAKALRSLASVDSVEYDKHMPDDIRHAFVVRAGIDLSGLARRTQTSVSHISGQGRDLLACRLVMETEASLDRAQRLGFGSWTSSDMGAVNLYQSLRTSLDYEKNCIAAQIDPQKGYVRFAQAGFHALGAYRLEEAAFNFIKAGSVALNSKSVEPSDALASYRKSAQIILGLPEGSNKIAWLAKIKAHFKYFQMRHPEEVSQVHPLLAMVSQPEHRMASMH